MALRQVIGVVFRRAPAAHNDSVGFGNAQDALAVIAAGEELIRSDAGNWFS